MRTIDVDPNTPNQIFGVELDGTSFRMALRFNNRDGYWYLSLYTSQDEPIVQGRKVVLDFPLWARYVDPRLPPGQVLAVDTSGVGEEAGEFDLGARVQLVYVEDADRS